MTSGARGDARPAFAWPEVAAVLARLGYPEALALRRLDEGAYSLAQRWLVELRPGMRAFVKAVTGDADDLDRQRGASQRGLGPIVPELVAWHRGVGPEPTVLVLEDLSAARWGTPVTRADAAALSSALDALDRHPARADDPPLATITDGIIPTWDPAHVDPAALVASGLADAAWCSDALPRLAAASASVDPTGDALVHDDLWRQNWCLAERGAVLVDCTLTRGNARVNRAWAECGVRAAGGPSGLLLAPDAPDHAAWAAWMSGLAVRFYLNCVSRHEQFPRLGETQLREAIAGLRWATDTLALPAPPLRTGLEPVGTWRP